MERVHELIAEIDELLPSEALDVAGLTIDGAPGFASAFALDRASLSAVGYANAVFGSPTVDADRLRTYFLTDVDVDGKPVPKWASLSGYYETSNGRHLQLHCNFPHHADGVVARLRCEPTRESVQTAILDWEPLELERALIADGMIAAYIRTLAEWDDHPHAAATSHLPLISVERLGDAAPRVDDGPSRVLDCSRVLAGPVAGQLFAAHGHDVLRIDSPHLPSVDICVMATGSGKRNAHLDLRNQHDAATFRELLETSDVWIDAYRPGAFNGLGFGVDAVADGGVVVQLSAFDTVGPWAGRRGFDSIVQSTTGIVEAGRVAAQMDAPTPLPVQALDYITGFVAAAAGERMRQHQRIHGGTWLVSVSLLRTRNWLLSLGDPHLFTPSPPKAVQGHSTTRDSAFGSVTVPLPVSGSIASPPEPLGTHAPHWQ